MIWITLQMTNNITVYIQLWLYGTIQTFWLLETSWPSKFLMRLIIIHFFGECPTYDDPVLCVFKNATRGLGLWKIARLKLAFGSHSRTQMNCKGNNTEKQMITHKELGPSLMENHRESQIRPDKIRSRTMFFALGTCFSMPVEFTSHMAQKRGQLWKCSAIFFQ